jgi:hypothetical protein
MNQGVRAIAASGTGAFSLAARACFASRRLRRFNPLSQVLRYGGMTYEDAQRIAARKSVWMVLWLRARRDGDVLRRYYAVQHFGDAR